ncbi:MAG TPA: SRPBCC family protein [Candidatus Thermoplasmatota archaeon]|nr:SRPBCC family protein [Candidatus Thermoplasmatota archaeon]
MGRHEIAVEAAIDASPAAVFKVLADPTKIEQWLPNVTSVHHLNDKKHVGAERQIKIRIYNIPISSHQVITEYEPGKRFAWVHTHDIVEGEPFEMLQDIGTIFELKGRGNKTNLTATAHFTPNGLKARLAVPLIASDIKKQMRSALENLKRLCES